MAVINIDDQTFANEVENDKAGTVLVDFWAPWCGPCKMLAPILDEVDEEIGDKVKIGKINVDENPEVPGRFGILSIPTLILFKDGKQVNKIVGLQSKEQLIEWINEHI